MNPLTPPDLDHEARQLMRAADPLYRADAQSDPGADTEVALGAVLARIDNEAQGVARRRPSRRRRRPRRALQLGAVGLAGAAAAILAVNLVPSSSVTAAGHRSGSVGSALGGVASARAATIAQVRHALAGVPGGILEVEVRSSIRKSSTDPLVQQTIHYWNQNDAPHNSVNISTGAGGTSTTGEEQGRLEYYDGSTNTLSVMTPTPAVEAATGPSPRAQAIALLNRAGTTVDRNASYGGQPAVELTRTSGGLVTTMYLAASGDTPLQYSVVSAPGSGGSYSMELQYLTYRTLTGAQAPASLVSLQAQHPSATVIHQDSTAWNAAESQLGG